MNIKARLAKLENKFIHNPQAMPEGLNPMEQYFFMINDTRYLSKQVSEGDTTITPEQAYLKLIGKEGV